MSRRTVSVSGAPLPDRDADTARGGVKGECGRAKFCQRAQRSCRQAECRELGRTRIILRQLDLAFGPSGYLTRSAIVTLAIEVTSNGTLSFMLALKPSLGDFAMRKRFRSTMGVAPTSSSSSSVSASEVSMQSAVSV